MDRQGENFSCELICVLILSYVATPNWL